MSTYTFRTPKDKDADRIKRIAVDAQMFTLDEVSFFDEILSGYFDGSRSDDGWLVVEDASGVIIAAAYYAPEPFADRMWNLYFLAVAPDQQGGGVGSLLIKRVEDDLRMLGDKIARIMIVETSSTEQYARTREFYRNHGYTEEARIRQFYGSEDDKVVFWKSLREITK